MIPLRLMSIPSSRQLGFSLRQKGSMRIERNMQNRYAGIAGQRLLKMQLLAQRVVANQEPLAEAIAERGQVLFPEEGDEIIAQGADTNDIYFILAGTVDVFIHGRRYTLRDTGRTVGEMSAIHPALPRSATVRAGSNCVLLRLDEPELDRIAEKYPQLWRRLAMDLAERLEQHTAAIQPCNERPMIFIFCGKEETRIAQAIQHAFEVDEAEFYIGGDELLRAAQYPLDKLNDLFRSADFAIAIAGPGDLAEIRGTAAPSSGIFVELGMALSRLGQKRCMLLAPREKDVASPSSFKGLEPILFENGATAKLPDLLGPAIHKIRAAVEAEGVCTDR